MSGVAVALSYGSAVAVEKYGGAEGDYFGLCGGSWGGQLKCEAALKRLFEMRGGSEAVVWNVRRL